MNHYFNALNGIALLSNVRNKSSELMLIYLGIPYFCPFFSYKINAPEKAPYMWIYSNEHFPYKTLSFVPSLDMHNKMGKMENLPAYFTC